MPALIDPMPATRISAPVTRSFAPVTRASARAKPTIRTSGSRPTPAVAPTRFAACLVRCAAAGIRLVVTSPSHTGDFAQGLERFPKRQIDTAAHQQWETAYRIFCGCAPQTHDSRSWRILAVDREDRVVGAITGRFFSGEVARDCLHVLALLDTTGPVFREHCELAVTELIGACRQTGRTPAEISHWAVAPVWHAALIAVTLIRAMGALVVAFDAPTVLMAADNRRGEVTRLMRLGAKPLGLAGHSCLPPFVHHDSGAWLRLLVLEAATFHARSRSAPAADLALLRQHASIICAG